MDAKIAVFLSYWSEEQSRYFLEGAKKRISEGGIHLSIFSSFGYIHGGKPVNIGENNIFSLPDLSTFDGVVIVSNTIYDKELLQQLFENVKEKNLPVISSDYDLGDPYCYFAGVDNRDGISQMMEHLISEHNCKTFHFVSGPANDAENIERLRGFKESLERHNLPFDKNNVFAGMYQLSDGIEAAQRYLSGECPLPDAIVCANDLMASGVCDEFYTHGIRVPEDVIVTGFDSDERVKHYRLKITTVDRPKSDLGYTCLDEMCKIISGESVKKKQFFKGRLLLSESCGCNLETYQSNDDYVRSIYKTNVTGSHNFVITKEVNEDLLTCEDFPSLLSSLNAFARAYFDYTPLLVIDDGYFRSLSTSNEDKRMVDGYSEKSHLFYFEPGSTSPSRITFTTKELIPREFKSQIENPLNIFYPLHFQDKCIGYIVVDGTRQAFSDLQRISFLSSLNVVFEHILQRITLENYNRKFQTLALMDSFTGLFNRLGFKEYGNKLFNECRKNKKHFLVLFVDIDGLKWINDNLGHEFGDIAIKKISQNLVMCCPTDNIAIRFGGDEFLILGPCDCEKDAEAIKSNLIKRLNDINERNELGFLLSVSVGYRICSPDENMTLNDCVNIADKEMYALKQQKKAQRTT